ncbi:MAG: hypothetical protein KGL39_41475 [Patescibacteria group bacterium]|nr:hypothetical protein [Patescibacteria group bacterium]
MSSKTTVVELLEYLNQLLEKIPESSRADAKIEMSGYASLHGVVCHIGARWVESYSGKEE